MSQGDIREKVARCERRGPGRGVVVWNDGGKEDLERNVGKVMEDIRRRSPRWWGFLLWVCPPLAALSGLVSWWKMKRVQESWEEEKKQEKAKL
jgi:dephospho-CoA kinase